MTTTDNPWSPSRTPYMWLWWRDLNEPKDEKPEPKEKPE